MKISVNIQRTKESKDVIIDNKITVKELLKRIDINSTTVIVTRNKEVIAEDTMLNNNDKLDILSVISGG